MAVENFVGVLRKFEAVGLAAAFAVEDADLDLGRMSGKDGEVGAFGVGRRAKRIGLAFTDAHKNPLLGNTGRGRLPGNDNTRTDETFHAS